jgi:hypothetical protein
MTDTYWLCSYFPQIFGKSSHIRIKADGIVTEYMLYSLNQLDIPRICDVEQILVYLFSIEYMYYMLLFIE